MLIKDMLVCVFWGGTGSIEKLYAFFYKPASPERKVNGWEIYSPDKEFARQGVSEDWRVSKINEKYTVCLTAFLASFCSLFSPIAFLFLTR